MRLWLIRHCQSEANVDINIHKTTPNDEVELSPHGSQHAYEVGELVRKKMIELGSKNYYMFRSPMRRAKRTSEVIVESLIETKIPMVGCRDDILLGEQNYGQATGCKHLKGYLETVPSQEMIRYRCGTLFYKFPQGESLSDVAVRSEVFMNKLSRYYIADDVLVVAHGGFCTMAEGQLLGEYKDNICQWSNGEIHIHDLDPTLQSKKLTVIKP